MSSPRSIQDKVNFIKISYLNLKSLRNFVMISLPDDFAVNFTLLNFTSVKPSDITISLSIVYGPNSPLIIIIV